MWRLTAIVFTSLGLLLLLPKTGLYAHRTYHRWALENGVPKYPLAKGRRSQAIWRVTAIVFTSLGLLLLLTTTGLYAYRTYHRWALENGTAAVEGNWIAASSQAILALASLPEPRTATPEPPRALAWTPLPIATPTDALTPVPPLSVATATSTVTPANTPTPVPLPPNAIVASSIRLQARVVAAVIQDGAWQVPKFVAGHLQDSAYPGQGSNIVIFGHVESISSGNVFANLGKLRVGDEVVLTTDEREFRYSVSEILTVDNTDLSVVQPTRTERLTLITCTGRWLPIERDYDKRMIVIAVP